MSDESKQPPDDQIPTESPIRQFPVRPADKTEQVVEPSDVTPKPVSPFAKFNGPNTSPAKLSAAAAREARRAKAYELWLWNTPWRQIAQILGVSVPVVFNDVMRHQRDLDRLNPNGTLQMRNKLVHQAERAQRALASKVAAGDTKAHEVYSMHADRIAKLMGVYAPVKVASTNPEGDAWAPLAATVLQQLSNEELALLAKLSDRRLLPAPADAQTPAIIDVTPVGAKR